MEEDKGLLLYGCNLAKDLEHNLPNITDKPDRVLMSCDEIIRVFSIIKERIVARLQQQPQDVDIGTSGVPKWPLRTTADQDHRHYYNVESVKMNELLQPSSLGLIIGFSSEVKNAPDPDRPSTSKRKRKDKGEEKIVKMMAAPRMGNLEHPPEDGFTWKKYGQKEILESKYPRSYYKCTHQKLYECPAKKQVQRLNNDPFTFEVTYIGSHSCNMMMSSTAIQPPPSTTAPPPINLPGSSNTTNPMQLFQDHHHVVDMADALFNSGGTVSNTMDFIFPSRDNNDKWNNPNQEKKD